MKRFIMLGAVLAVLGACSTGGGQYGEPHYYASTLDGPPWAMTPEKYQKEHPENHYFSGMSTVHDESIARVDAKFAALAELADQIRTDIHHLYVSGQTHDQAAGESNAEKAIENGILSVSHAVVSGAKVDQYKTVSYWTQIGPDFPKVDHRHTWALVVLSPADYRKAVVDTLSGLKKEVQDPRARAVVDEMKRRFLNNGRG